MERKLEKMADELKVGLVGLGYIGKIHATGYRNIPLCYSEPKVTARLAAVLRSRLDTEGAFMNEVGFEMRTKDPAEFYDAPLDLVDVCTPNHLHHEQVKWALERKIHVYCEKPLAMDLAQAKDMAKQAEQASVLTHVAFVLRYIPAIRQMKALLQQGAIGEVLNFRAHMFHSGYLDPQRPMSWRLRKAEAGGGVFADLGAHLIDLVRYLLGDIAHVSTQTRTYIDERPVSKGSEVRQTVDVDDWAHCNLELVSGTRGHIEVTRMAAGASESTALEIYGNQGALLFQVSQPHFVRFYDLKRECWSQGAIRAPTPEGERPIDSLWPSGKYSQGLMSDAHLASLYDFMLCIQEGKPSTIDFQAGMAVQEVLQAAYNSAERDGDPVRLPI